MMKCPKCNETLRRIAHVIVKGPVNIPLDKTGIRKKEVRILGVKDGMYFCGNGCATMDTCQFYTHGAKCEICNGETYNQLKNGYSMNVCRICEHRSMSTVGAPE